MPLEPPQPLPQGTTLGDEFARELARLLGPAYQPVDGTSLIAEDLHVLGAMLADRHAAQTALLEELFPATVDALRAEWETRVGITSDPGATLADRRAALLANRRATGGGTEQRLMAAVHAIDPTATLVRNDALDVTALPRAVFVVAIVLDVAVWADLSKRAALRAVVNQMKAAHVHVNLPTQVGFYCDDPASLTDRDCLAA